MIPRLLSTKLKQLAKYYPVVSLAGPRQSGKSTLVKTCFAKHKYVSLEDADVRTQSSEDPRLFLRSLGKTVIIDEAQRAPELFSYLQGVVDSGAMKSVILTGSQNFLLMEKVTQSLAGRVGLLTLLPFSYLELRKANRADIDFEQYAVKGSYPRVYDKDIPPPLFYPSYTQTYIERDVRQLINVSDLTAFQRFLKLCAGRAGQVLNATTLSNDCGISVNTVKSWLSVLEASYVVFRLPPYFNNFNKRIIRSPKLYFYDTGLLCSLLDIKEPSQLHAHHARGFIFENLVIAEVMKNVLNKGERPQLFYWRESNGLEIDLLIQSGNNIHAVEIKSSQTMNPALLSALHRWRALDPKSNTRCSLLYAGDISKSTGDVKILNWKSLERL